MCSALGTLLIASAGLAPGAAAEDIQSKQWYLNSMGADEIWKYSTGKGVKVAVIDSGVNPATSTLKGQVLVNQVPKSVAYKAAEDNDGHGTGMAEIIAGTGAGGGVKGLAPGAKIIPYHVQQTTDRKDDDGKFASLADVIRAAADTDVKIINMSFGGPYPDSTEEDAIKYAASKGKLMFASIGNDGEKGKAEYPAVYPYVVGVSAIDKSGTVAKFSTKSNYVDFAAPGVSVPGWCDGKFTEYCDTDGTSPATALASASAALVWSVHPDWTANQVLRTLLDTAGRSWPKDKPSTYLGYGAIRPRRVLINKNIDPGPANRDPLYAENGTDPNEDVTATPSLSVAPSSGATAKDSGSTSGATSAAAKDSGSGSNTTTWVIIGAVAAVLVIGGAGFGVLRARRNA
ncbi:serine protease [Streptomyces cellostaticus]|uniref:Serine protease n=1 Tax=Streptomyces cellostaticus TaxID=67285 RepID=A0A101NDW6_9ACTN|nr:S8 family serine peptidase [Streptomyces cellostaticus]KUM91344.1 serine protease [Streptomyces cellostaticus]